MGVFTLTTNPVTAEFNGPTDPESFSGARVARMILRSLGLADPLAPQQMLDHAKAYNDAGENWPFWYIDPVAMQHTLADFDPRPPGGFPGHWRVYTNTDQTLANNQMRYTMDNYQVAPAALVYGGQHWLAVVGYSFDDTGATTGFIIDDPAYNGGGANVAVNLTMWNSAFTPVSGGTKWLNAYVEVGDPDPATEVPAQARPQFLRVGGAIIPPEEAVKLAIEGALRQFDGLPNLREALEHGQADSPRLVSRLDQRGSYYYLVPVEREHGSETPDREQQVLAVIMLDARFGNVLAVSASAEPYTPWPISRRRAIELLTERPVPVYEPVEVAADRLVDAISAVRDPAAGLVASGCTALRRTVGSALGSFATPSDYLVLRSGEFEISPVLAWHPSSGATPFHPYLVARTPWQDVYINIHSGLIHVIFPISPRLGG